MADFNEVKQSLRQARTGKADAQLNLSRARERERSLTERINELKRGTNPNNEANAAEINRLEGLLKEAQHDRSAATGNFNESKFQVDGIWQQFQPFTDPREQIGRFFDMYPILMFPLRLETRFKTIRSDLAGTRHQLWVRVFPDECLVDTFEQDLTEMERLNARRYWAFHWAAAGDETQERAAWKELVAAHGSGRAGWIRKNYQPTNAAEQPPVPNPAGNFNLVIPVQDGEPVGADATAVAEFWKKVFLKTENALNASDLAKKYPPANLNETAPDGANVVVSFVRFPAFGEEASKPFSWSQPPKVQLLPERFVFLGYNGGVEVKFALSNLVQTPLFVGPNPTATQEEQFQETAEGDLVVPEEIRWMTDFEEAVAKGMGFRIDLEPALAQSGFERVLVLGVRLGSSPGEGQEELEDLLRKHLYGRSGFALVPQGTPTNNTEENNAGYSRADDPDESFPIFVKEKEQFTTETDPLKKRDGQWLAEWLGVNPDLLKQTSNADESDIIEAKAMNTALFPATIGYWMQKMMNPVFKDSPQTVEMTRRFFTQFVSGRGQIPAVRVGRQPYGILPASAYTKIKWLQRGNDDNEGNIAFVNNTSGYLSRLYQLLMNLNETWKNLAINSPHVAVPTSDPQQNLLDIIALHPASVEYHARLSHGRNYLWNYYLFSGLSFDYWKSLLEEGMLVGFAKLMLANFGYSGEAPKIFEKYYRSGQQRINGPIIDDQPLSESALIRNYSESNRNYIGWLIEALGDYEGMLLPQSGQSERPKALLYTLLRHALLEEYDNAGHKTRFNANVITQVAYHEALVHEPEFIHVQANTAKSESRIAHLLEPEPTIFANQNSMVKNLGQEVKKVAPAFTSVVDLKEMETALKTLENVPTAALERLLAEHIDCCSYRHDAWLHGLLNYQLSLMRYSREGTPENPLQGVYLGAYGWLENLKPENKIMTPVRRLPEDLTAIFQRPGDAPLTIDNTNQGYIHAPSLNHAVTAAVLRNGYLSNATPTEPDLLNVNLSSERVRKALDTLEGIRNGQSLGALLGYRFERSLHDRQPQLFVFSYQLRKAFPLVANKLQSTKDATPEAAEAIAARNVVDGYALLKKSLDANGKPNFAFLTGLLNDPAPNATQRGFIEESILDLLDIHDALSDLGIAESVHQIVQGNYDRAAASMDAYSKATFPQAPDVAITPRSGAGLTQRVAIHLNGQASPGDPSPVASVAHTPRSLAEPAVNQWLASLLPAASAVATVVSFTNPGGVMVTTKVTQADLELQPLDLLYLFHVDVKQALGALDELILRHLFETPVLGVHANAKIEIKYTEPILDGLTKATFFELSPMLRSLRSLVLTGRPLRPTDAAPPGEASAENEPPSFLDKTRLTVQTPLLQNHENDLDNLLLAWTPLPDVDDQISDFTNGLSLIGLFGMAEASFGFAYSWRQEQYVNVLNKTNKRMALWQGRLDEYNNLINVQLPLAANDEQRFDILRKAEALVSTENTTPLPVLVATYQAMIQSKGNDFSIKKAALEGITANPPDKLNGLIAAINAELPLTGFDGEAFDLAEQEALVDLFQQDLIAKIEALKLELQTRRSAANQQVLDADAATEPGKKTELLQAAGKTLFGEEFLMVPNFQLAEKQGFEWQNALDAQAQVLQFQTTDKTDPDPFPVDTWLYGVARVREKLRHLENAWLLAEAFGKTPLDLQPAQFPFRRWKPQPDVDPTIEAPEPWLALEYPSNFQLKEEKILYTAAYPAAFNRTQPQCGLLLDEWTEVVPMKEETTGLTFHYDRPNAEPPQAWLLATPSAFTGEWQWQDLVDALHETLDLAKQRAVEPAQVEATPVGVFSPATVFPVTPWRIHNSLNLSVVNKVLTS